MLPHQVLHLLIFFDIFGYNSGWSPLSRHHRLANILYFIHIFSAAVFVAYFFRLISIYYLKLQLAEAISECLQYTAALYTYLSIIFDSFVYRQTHARFWQMFEHLNHQQKTDSRVFDFRLRKYMFKLSLFGFKIAVTCGIRLGGHSIQKFEIDAPYVILFTICEIRMFYYLLCLEIVNGQLKMVALNSQWIVNGVACYDTEYVQQQWKWIRQFFSDVHSMTCHLNNIFEWLNVTAISFSFCFILTELNWYYVHFEEISPLNTFSTWYFALHLNKRYSRQDVNIPKLRMNFKVSFLFSHGNIDFAMDTNHSFRILLCDQLLDSSRINIVIERLAKPTQARSLIFLQFGLHSRSVLFDSI